jgi:hypothetical protein
MVGQILTFMYEKPLGIFVDVNSPIVLFKELSGLKKIGILHII